MTTVVQLNSLIICKRADLFSMNHTFFQHAYTQIRLYRRTVTAEVISAQVQLITS